jgi:hypothetical protein
MRPSYLGRESQTTFKIKSIMYMWSQNLSKHAKRLNINGFKFKFPSELAVSGGTVPLTYMDDDLKSWKMDQW